MFEKIIDWITTGIRWIIFTGLTVLSVISMLCMVSNVIHGHMGYAGLSWFTGIGSSVILVAISEDEFWDFVDDGDELEE